MIPLEEIWKDTETTTIYKTMSEEDQIFDSSLKKKKKKKKTPFDIDGLTGADDAVPADDDGDKDDEKEDLKSDDVNLDDDFSALNKKKKKKKKPFDFSELEEAVPKVEEEGGDDQEEDTVPTEAGNEDTLDFSLPSKKKKKKKVAIKGDFAADKEEESKTAEDVAWQDTDRDYTYDELIKRVFDIMREKNPDMVAGEKKRFVMKPPQVMRVGTKKSSFSNFAEICKMLHRQPKHLLAFLLAELGTSGSLDGTNQLIIKGRFQQKQIESVLRRYIKEYVTCHTCRSPDTILQKDTRLYFLQCETCGSRCSVASIKSGFQAVTGKRAAIRAKTT